MIANQSQLWIFCVSLFKFINGTTLRILGVASIILGVVLLFASISIADSLMR